MHPFISPALDSPRGHFKTQGFLRVFKKRAPGIQLGDRGLLQSSHGLIEDLTIGIIILARFYKGLVDIIRFAKYCRVCVQDIGAGT